MEFSENYLQFKDKIDLILQSISEGLNKIWILNFNKL